jgi:hypothetical protein
VNGRGNHEGAGERGERVLGVRLKLWDEGVMNDDRRNRIRTAIALINQAETIIQDVLIEEEDAHDSRPENLSGSAQGQQSQDAAKALDRARDVSQELIDHLEIALNSQT